MYYQACALILFVSSLFAQESFLAEELGHSKVIIEKDAAKPLKPASVAKLFVIGSLLDRAEEQFVTKIYETKDSIILSFDIDPLFTTERLFKVIERLAALGKPKPILELEFPDVEGGKERVGSRAYETGVDGVMFNFNSVEIVGCSEPKILPLFAGFSIISKEGEFNAECGSDHCTVYGSGDCASKFRSVSDPKLYLKKSVEGLSQLLLSYPVVVKELKEHKEKKLIAEVPGSKVKESLEALGQYSTNSVAEMLLYLLGDRKSYSKGLENLNVYASKFTKYPVLLKDGSGLSHDSRVPVDSIVRLLQEEERDLPRYLSISGKSGTLKDRPLGARVFAKTGSLDGVSTLAGYIFEKKIAFAIFQQGKASKSREEEFIKSLVK